MQICCQALHGCHGCTAAEMYCEHKPAVVTESDCCWLLQLIQYAKHAGIKTINIVRRQEQVQQLKDLG